MGPVGNPNTRALQGATKRCTLAECRPATCHHIALGCSRQFQGTHLERPLEPSPGTDDQVTFGFDGTDDFSLDSCSAQGKNPALEFSALGHQGMRGHMAPKLRVHQASPINKEKIRLKSSESK